MGNIRKAGHLALSMAIWISVSSIFYLLYILIIAPTSFSKFHPYKVLVPITSSLLREEEISS